MKKNQEQEKQSFRLLLQKYQALPLTWKLVPPAALLLVILAVTAAFFIFRKEYTADFRKKAELLQRQILTESVYVELGVNPAGVARYAVFFSVSDRTERAQVCSGTGDTPEAAWENAVHKTETMLRRTGLRPEWVKADLVYDSNTVSTANLKTALLDSAPSSLRYGLALDGEFKAALLEEELNGAGIYDYETGGVSLNAMNRYLRNAGRKAQTTLPTEFIAFRCFSWLCDEQGTVYELGARERDQGRRSLEALDEDYAAELVCDAAAWLGRQVGEDGSISQALDARFDRESETDEGGYHVQALLAMLSGYRLKPDKELKKAIDSALGFLAERIVRDPRGRLYLYDEEAEEIRLGDCAQLVLVLTEYMDVFEDDRYREQCIALGEGILNQFDTETGTFRHVLNSNFARKEQERSVSYDGQAVCALCRLYGLTEGERWLNAAGTAADRLVSEEYSAYADPWASRAMSELIEYEPDRVEYYALLLETGQRNLDRIAGGENPMPADLEILMLACETEDRLTQNGGAAGGFDSQRILETIADRADRQLNGYFYPEYAMYMERPDRILGTFMDRRENFRVSVDDVSRIVAGYYLYVENYDILKKEN